MRNGFQAALLALQRESNPPSLMRDIRNQSAAQQPLQSNVCCFAMHRLVPKLYGAVEDSKLNGAESDIRRMRDAEKRCS